MEKASMEMEMDLEEWEFLPDNKASLDHFGHVGGGKDLYPNELFFDHKGIIDMNYFIYEADHQKTEQTVMATDPVAETKEKGADDPLAREFEFKDIGVIATPAAVIAANHGVASQVFFDKLKKQSELVDMKKPDSPKSVAACWVEPEPVRFDEESKKSFAKEEDEEEEEERVKEEEEIITKGKACLEGFGFSIWRWRLTGIGALCSLGVAAAATICIFILGGQQRQKHLHHHHHNHKIQFQIYPDDKRITQVVQQATRLNQALSAARGSPITRANISFGGYYDGL